YRQVVETYGRNLGTEVIEIPYQPSGQTDLSRLEAALDDAVAAVVVQSPNFFGAIESIPEIAAIVHRRGALLVVVVAEPLSLALVKPPRDADVVCGEAQSFGVPVAFGGPYCGFLATKEKFVRQMPGRLAGATVDTQGRRGFVLTLVTREQFIRREKATSNICTSQSLCALAATFYLCLLGKHGIRKLAEQNLAKAHYCAREITSACAASLPFSAPYFNEFVVRVPGPAGALLAALRDEKIIGGLDLGRFYPELQNHLLVCVTELVAKETLDRMVSIYQDFHSEIGTAALSGGRAASLQSA
ncbi:MAG: aminotransferase class V-fold PLP-dependent enzyme, partial [Terriglobia bacterium]